MTYQAGEGRLPGERSAGAQRGGADERQRHAVLRTLKGAGELTPGRIAQQVENLDNAQAAELLNNLHHEGVVGRTPQGGYRLAPAAAILVQE